MTWLSRKDYSNENAINQIEEFIQPWVRNPSWLYCIDAVNTTDKKYSTEYTFRVRWSIPTNCKPIPVASASVYFTYQVLKKCQEDVPSEVKIRYESNTLELDSQVFVFNEANLFKILDAKAKVLEGQAF